MTLIGNIASINDAVLTGNIAGIKGDTGVGIASITENDDYTITIALTDGSTLTTDPIAGFTSVVVNDSGNLVVTKTDGTTVTLDIGLSGYQTAIEGYKNDAQISAGTATTQALKAEGNAVGKQNGTDVTSDSEYYHNNSKYYSQQALSSANSASTSASNASASETAVSGVKTQLQNRMTAIETEQIVQDARMDSFTTLAEGSTTGDAELIDGRVGADGVTYNNIGSAIRGQVSNIKYEIQQDETLHIVLESGNFNDTTGAKANGATRIRSAMLVPILNIYAITFPQGYDAYIYRFRADKSYINCVGWKSGNNLVKDITTSETTYINILFRNNSTPSADISSEVGSVESQILIETKDSELSQNINDTGIAYLDTNCAEIVSLLKLKPKTSAGITFTPSQNSRVITTSGTASGTAQYYLFRGDIQDTPFVSGNKYRIQYNAPTGAYLQIISNTSDVVLNTVSFSGTQVITIPIDCTTLQIKLYCESTVPTGTHKISIINERSVDYLENKLFDEKISLDELEMLVGASHDNLFDGITITDGYYVNMNNGNVASLASYSVTDYFEVYPNVTYDFSVYSSGSQIACYDDDKRYVAGVMADKALVTMPNNSRIKYAKWCAETAKAHSCSVYIEPIIPKIKKIDSTEGLLAGIKDAYSKGIKKVVVSPGVYDIIAEYESYYGANYFTNYTNNYNGEANGVYDRGLWLDNIDISFEAGAKVTANYTGANAYVKEWFSAFAIGQNVTIDGLVLDASELRYGLHPDFHYKQTETLTIKNCDLHHYKSSSAGVNNNQAVGAGLGVYSDWNIENCIFRSDTSNAVLRIHNNASVNAKSKILIKDCYIIGDGYIRLNSYSTSTKQTMALVTGCSWKTPAVVGKETQDSNDNITMLAWNNEVRS